MRPFRSNASAMPLRVGYRRGSRVSRMHEAAAQELARILYPADLHPGREVGTSHMTEQEVP